MSGQPVLVVGCGVIGLTSALELQRAGFAVTIAARALPPETVSNIAAAFWYPYAVAPAGRCAAWARESLEVFRRQSADLASGVILRRGIELYPPGCGAPSVVRSLPNARMARADELRAGYASGLVFEAPVIETGIYLPWLIEQFRAGGGGIEVTEFESLAACFALAPIVVNCSGLGSRELVDDPSVHAIRGQILRVARGTLEEFVLDHRVDGGSTYIIPRSKDCVLGGTLEAHREDLTVDLGQSEDILRRCSALRPELAGARVLETLVGLRPGRPLVRLEEESDPRGLLVHNYGHGGAGVTLSWGCAREVRRRIG